MGLQWPWHRRKHRRALRAVKKAHEILAAYDAAQTTADNRRQWAQADLLSPVAASSAGVRGVLRSRARYEVASNSLAKGIVLTLANDLIGTGPRLQLVTDSPAVNKLLEAEFARWAAAIRLPQKLRTMRMAKAQDGEAFAVLITNEALGGPVQLDIQLVEADRVTTPNYGLAGTEDEQKAIDGIVFDKFGNPQEYHILKRHPGAIGLGWKVAADAALHDRVPAKHALHWFSSDRPEQRRGLPDIMAALPLFPILRRYMKATLLSAETAAALALVMSTSAPADGEAAEVEAWSELEMAANTAVFAPEGWEPKQMKAEQPTGTFTEFRMAVINEVARCVNMPLNIAACDSSKYNYASGRLDHQTYFKSIRVERDEVTTCVLDPLLTAWIAEALQSPSLGIYGQVERINWPHTWYWDGREHVDPLKEARAAVLLLKEGLLTEAEYYGKHGLDWQDQQVQRQREATGRTERGLPSLLEKAEAAGAGFSIDVEME